MVYSHIESCVFINTIVLLYTDDQFVYSASSDLNFWNHSDFIRIPVIARAVRVCRDIGPTKVQTMSSTVPLLMRVIANSVTCATRAGLIIKETMKTGNLNIVEKASVASVGSLLSSYCTSTPVTIA